MMISGSRSVTKFRFFSGSNPTRPDPTLQNTHPIKKNNFSLPASSAVHNYLDLLHRILPKPSHYCSSSEQIVTTMSDRRRIPQIHDDRSFHEPGMMRHGPAPGLRSSAHRPTDQHRALSHHLEDKLAAQLSEIERLARDNRMLASSHVALREDLIASHREIQSLRGYIRSIDTESDIQTRVLLEKMVKMEADLRGGESVKKEYHREHMEAQGLLKAREELMAQIQQKIKELEKAHADIKRLPDMHTELADLRQEHQRLRTNFQYEKGLNLDKVEKMQVMEKDHVGMAREVEMLRAEVLNAENRARAPNPYPDPFMQPNPFIHSSGPFSEHFGAVGEGMGLHGVSGSTIWGGAYDAPPPPR